MDKIAVHKSENSEKVIRFIDQDVLNEKINNLIENGNLHGIYFDENGEMVAKDIWGDVHQNIEA